MIVWLGNQPWAMIVVFTAVLSISEVKPRAVEVQVSVALALGALEHADARLEAEPAMRKDSVICFTSRPFLVSRWAQNGSRLICRL